MRVALVRPPSAGGSTRGVGFLVERLLPELKKIKGLDVELVNFSRRLTAYSRFDVVHFPYFDEYFLTLPPVLKTKFIVSILDFTKLRFPQHFPAGVRGKLKWAIQKRLVTGARAIITISHSARADIEKYLSLPANKIFVTYLAADRQYHQVSDKKLLAKIAAKYHLSKQFVLYVGGVNWNKNLPTLINACQEKNLDLILVGREFVNENLDFNHPENRPFAQTLELIKAYPKARRLGFIPTDELAVIYNLAGVYVQPSVFEGFGLPVLEALACGCPVVCGQVGSLPEVAGEAAVYADVISRSDLAEKIINTLTLSRSDREVLIQRCLSQADKFSWEKTAAATYEVYKKILTV